MAGGAVLISGVGHIVRRRLRRDAGRVPAEIARAVVAFQAHREYDGSSQQARVWRAVWEVARFATIHANRCMLEHERAAFLGVALEAGLLVRERLVHHARAGGRSPRRLKSAVRI